jgi:hypothetical protein
MGELRCTAARRNFAAMTQNTRFELRLPADQRRELGELAREVGLSSADLARLGIGWLLRHPGVLLEREQRTEG